MKKNIIATSLLGTFVLAGVLAASTANAFHNSSLSRLEAQEALEEALANSDYEAWSALMAGHAIARNITAENFPKLVEAYQLMQEGEKEEAQTILQELGVRGFRDIRPTGDRPLHTPHRLDR